MGNNGRNTTGRTLTMGALMLWGLQSTAHGHHMEDGRMPGTLGEGLLSGLAHPVIGLDHLAFIIALGLLSTRWQRGVLLPFLVLPAALLGTGMHLLGWNLPAVEIAIALSVVAFAAFLASAGRPSLPILGLLAGLFGIAHGYAYGEAIIGAEQQALSAYLAGFTVVQVGIAVAVRQGALLLWKGSEGRAVPALRFAGVVLGAVGLVHLALGFPA